MYEYETKDSGTRREFSTGSKRDAATGKGRFDLITPFAWRRTADFMMSNVNVVVLHGVTDRFEAEHMYLGNAMQCLVRHVAKGSSSDWDHLAEACCYVSESMRLDHPGTLVMSKEDDDPSCLNGFAQLSPRAMTRLAQLYERGAEKYDDRNWEKGQPQSVFLDSAMRHLTKAIAGTKDEDHEASVMWNVFCMMHQEHQVVAGNLNKELLDLPVYPNEEMK